MYPALVRAVLISFSEEAPDWYALTTAIKVTVWLLTIKRKIFICKDVKGVGQALPG